MLLKELPRWAWESSWDPLGFERRSKRRKLQGVFAALTDDKAPMKFRMSILDVFNSPTVQYHEGIKQAITDVLMSGVPELQSRAAEILIGPTDMPETVHVLLELFSDQSAPVEVRERCGYALSHKSSSLALGTAIEIYRDASEEIDIRDMALRIVGANSLPSALDTLMDALTDPDDQLRSRASNELTSSSRLGSTFAKSEVLSRITPYFSGDDIDLKKECIQMLVYLRPASWAEILTPLLEDADDNVRIITASVFRLLGDSATIGNLLTKVAKEDADGRTRRALLLADKPLDLIAQVVKQGLENKDSKMRTMAAYVIAHGDWTKAQDWRLLESRGLGLIQTLTKMLEAAENHGDDLATEERRSASSALIKLGPDKYLEELQRHVDDPDWMVRSHIASALGHSKEAQAIQSLAKLLTDERREVRSNAAWGLYWIAQSEIGPHLTPALSDDDHETRKWAAEGLGTIKHADAVPALVGLLRDDHRDVRVAACDALANIGTNAAVEPLIDLIDDEEPRVRGAAAGALGELDDSRATAALLRLLGDPDVGPYWIRSETITKLSDPDLTELLIEKVSAGPGPAADEAAMCLHEIGGEKAETIVEEYRKRSSDFDTALQWSDYRW